MSVLELEDVTKAYRAGEMLVAALRGVSFTVAEGEFVAIMGESGSGKTTLLGILGCLDRPTSGSYRLAGEEVAPLSETRRARLRGAQIGFIFQAYNLLPRTTAAKNVELPLVYAGVPARERKRRMREALAAVGLEDRIEHEPNQLSGGQQQRVRSPGRSSRARAFSWPTSRRGTWTRQARRKCSNCSSVFMRRGARS